MVMEFSVGRASKKSVIHSFKVLEPKGTKWHNFGIVAVIGNYILMMFYTVVAGWMLSYLMFSIKGDLQGLNPQEVGGFFNTVLSSPKALLIWMFVAILLGFTACFIGLRKGVERITKVMMIGLLTIMGVLAVRSITLDGASSGLSFFLIPNFDAMLEKGIGETIYIAMGQAFFTLSVGIGSMAIFGSYIGKEKSLTNESLHIITLDTFVAILAGLIIFPAASAFGVDVGAGPGLIFVTLPNIFNEMAGGYFWGILFFLFLSFAAMTTVIAVFENIVAFAMDLGWSRKKSVIVNIFIITILSTPCALGFNVLCDFQPLGAGTNILDLEDFILSNNLMPIGCMVYLFFCCYKFGWGWDNFINEADTGHGIKFPNTKIVKVYVKYIMPMIVLFIFLFGYLDKLK